MSQKIKVCHISTVHTLHDTRILYRECASLVDSGYEVSLVITSDKDDVINGVKIVHIPRQQNRFLRMLLSPLNALHRALGTKARVYHLHDPELIPLGLILRAIGKKVIFDVHENIAENIKEKKYLRFCNQLALIYRGFEWAAAKYFYLIVAENSYLKTYEHLTKRVRVVLNTPDITFFEKFHVEDRRACNKLYYIGAVSQDRGSVMMIEVMDLLQKNHPDLVYDCVGPALGAQHGLIVNNPGYSAVKDSYRIHGRMPLADGYDISREAAIGIAILYPTKNYFESYPTKIFEYMAIGLPVVTSNFPLYREVIEANECGICVDPGNPQEIAEQISKLLNDPERRQRYAENGRRVVKSKYSWEAQRKELEAAYKEVLG